MLTLEVFVHNSPSSHPVASLAFFEILFILFLHKMYSPEPQKGTDELSQMFVLILVGFGSESMFIVIKESHQDAQMYIKA